jgi:pimeloyl-ACP methyl ester carboxylesterase
MNLKAQIIRVNDINLNIVMQGTGPAVILLHGFPDSAYLWRNQIPVLAEAGYKVIAPDLRGFGDSDAPEGKKHYTTDKLVGDVIALMDYLGVSKACVVGHDWGAIIGWILSIFHPELVDRYVAISVGHPKVYSTAGLEQKLRAWYAVAFQLYGIAELTIRMNNWFMLRKLTKDHPETNHWIDDLSRRGYLTAGMNWYRANLMKMLLGNFPPSKVPTLGIWSSGDIFLTEDQMKNSGAYVDAPWRYEKIEGSSHWIPLDAAERLNQLLIEYIKQPLR